MPPSGGAVVPCNDCARLLPRALLPAAHGSVLTCGTCGYTMLWDQCTPGIRRAAIRKPEEVRCINCLVC